MNLSFLKYTYIDLVLFQSKAYFSILINNVWKSYKTHKLSLGLDYDNLS